MTEGSIETVLNLICRYIEEVGFHLPLDNMVMTATTLVEKYGREEETGKKFDETILKFTEVALQQLERTQAHDLHERKAGVIMGILLSAMHRNADRNHKFAVNCVAATSVAVTVLWAWSYLGTEVAIAAAVSVTSFTLFEYLNLTPGREFGFNEVNLALTRAILNVDNGIGSMFREGIGYAKEANGIREYC